jgi:hypothetical protein
MEAEVLEADTGHRPVLLLDDVFSELDEGRSERLLEFLELNPGMPVLGLREGTAVRVDASGAALLGERPARAFLKGREPWDVAPGSLADFPPRG